MNAVHLQRIEESCNCYFSNNPYDRWFKKLDNIISGSGHSYYFPYGNACHLDLVPFATNTKWGSLDGWHKRWLQDVSSNALGLILNKSEIKLLVLNGQSVVDGLTKISDVSMQKSQSPKTSLNRSSSKSVTGYVYVGSVNKIGTITLTRRIIVLGYNHNIQSSYGVTRDVQNTLRDWIAKKVNILL